MEKSKTIAVNACRLLVAAVFIFSGYVKAIDPHGTQYKIEDYLRAMSMGGWLPDWVTLTMSIGLSALEFSLGVFLLFAIQRRASSRAAVVLMAAMTAITVWLAGWNPIDDCGCFGDAVHLTHGETLAKNAVLLAATVVVARWPLRMKRLLAKRYQWIVSNAAVLFIVASAGWSLYHLPQIDFRPYHIGADLRRGMEMPEGAEEPQFETTFILEKNGRQREFTLDDYPDSTWTFIDSRTVQVSEGYVPPIHDFSITTERGADITEEVVGDTAYTFLLVAPYLEKADDTNFGDVNRIYDFCAERGVRFLCLTASTERGINRWRDLTGAEYTFCTTDATTLQTMIRSNPGLLLLKDGIIIDKWGHNDLPNEKYLTDYINL